MKQLVRLSVLFLLVFAGFAFSLDIVIDAQRDAFYNTLTGPADGYIYMSPISNGQGTPAADDEFDCSGLIFMAWDPTYYYFYAEVKDELINVNNATVYENDCIELKIDPDPLSSTEATTGVAATRMSALSADDAEVPAGVQNVDSGEMTGGWVPTEEDYFRIETTDGYNLEWRIPWDAIQQGDRAVSVGVGEVFGLAINLMDNDDTARSTVLRWSSDMADLVWNTPFRHGTVTFLEGNKLGMSTLNTITGIDTNTVDYTPPPTAVKTNDLQVPKTLALAQNYPNPFNPVTTIEYSTAKQEMVNLSVYDLNGRKIQTLVNAVQTPGEHRVTFDASELSSGVYLYRVQAGEQSITNKMSLVR